ncbi:MAG: ATP synthase F1 subunit delta [Planctomycetota bacterium]|nr:MAG: ATP synthase F1 subunit delta [Planctomycetota bacterium]
MAEVDPRQARIPSVMEDPSVQAIAKVYARAFLGAAADLGAEDEPLAELADFVRGVLEAFPEFAQLLFSPLVSRDDKLRMIDHVVAPRATELVTSFLRTLARHDRLDLLPVIVPVAQRLLDEKRGRRKVGLITARPLSDDARGRIAEAVQQRFGFTPVLETSTDPSLIAGIVLRIGDTVYDGSLRARLQQLRLRLRERGLHEVQSGRDRFGHPEGN